MAELETEVIGREILYFPKLPSTNATAKEHAEAGAKEGTVIIAEMQTQGRGRLERQWISPKGGVWLSIILRPQIAAEDAQKITLTTAVAVAKTLNKQYPMKAQIKWPNDILINNKKICGILTEAVLKEEKVDFIIVGIGVNANFSGKTLPEDVRPAATTLQDVLGRKVTREKLISGLLREFESYYDLIGTKRFERVLNEWRSLAGFLGKQVEIIGFGEKLRGEALDIDEDGALVIELENGETKRVVFGDVSVRQV